MKKILSILIVSIIILTLSACSCEHDWEEADCINKKTCVKCGETEGEALGHNWQDADCVKSKNCSVCGAEEGEELGHKWKEADCVNPKKCTRCNLIEGNSLGHNFKPATYEEPRICERCGDCRGEPLTRPSQWGFNNLAEMDYMLVRISSYTIKSQKSGYVILEDKPEIVKFENGYKVRYIFEVKNGKCVLSNSGSAQKYSIAANETMDINNGYKSFEIIEKLTSDVKNNFVVFKTTKNILYVPYTLIDWSKGMQKNSNGEKILYLIP